MENNDAIYLSFADSELVIYPQGAHLGSWKYKGIEQLFLSERAIFEPGTALRGGVPICFPQFAVFGPGKKHGFARSSMWQHANKAENQLRFILPENWTNNDWPHNAEVNFEITLENNTLKMTLIVVNTSEAAFEFTSALHSYFRVDDVRQIAMSNLHNCEYWDNGTEFSKRQIEEQPELGVNAAIDRVYFNVEQDVLLTESGSQRCIKSRGFSDMVVWNPWLEGAQGLKDMADDEYLKMICIESANVQHPTLLKAGETWSGTQSISIES